MKTKFLIITGVFLLSSCDDCQRSCSRKIGKMENKSQSLKNLLNEKKENFELNADEEKKKVYKEGIESVKKSGIIEQALNVGDIAPDFVLSNALGEPIQLNKLLEKGKVILTWYRGGWCPYCNLTLHQLQQELPNFKANGASLVALTPELPDKSLNTAEKHNLEFEVLSDIGNKIAKKYGIIFKLTDEVAKMYNDSFNLKEYNGDNSNELPLAATYVIGQDGKIIYAFLDAEYRNRAEPSEITDILKKNVVFQKTFILQNISFVVRVAKERDAKKLTIQIKGPEMSDQKIELELDGKVVNAEVEDLDLNGFPEILIYTTSMREGNYGNVIGYSVDDNGKSVSKIYFPKISENKEARIGYRGHDEFSVVKTTLVRTFPIYTDHNLIRGTRQIDYKLRNKEGSRSFVVDRAYEYK